MAWAAWTISRSKTWPLTWLLGRVWRRVLCVTCTACVWQAFVVFFFSFPFFVILAAIPAVAIFANIVLGRRKTVFTNADKLFALPQTTIGLEQSYAEYWASLASIAFRQ